MRRIRALRDARRRRPNPRGVSPLIATILLVAITIVLAAVLYVLVAHVATGAGAAAPLGTSLLVGPVKDAQGSSATHSYCQKNHYCYSVSVSLAATGITLDSLAFRVVDAQGAPWTVGKNYARITVVDLSGSALAFTKVGKHQPFDVTEWTNFGLHATGATALGSTTTIWVQFGQTKSAPFGQGLVLEVLGTGGYSGQVTAALP